MLASEREYGTLYSLWEDNALDFVTQILGENIWTKAREILEAVPRNIRTAVPSCFSSGKSWSSSRLVLWKSMVHPPETVKVVTLAPKWSQVETIIWPEVRNAHARSGLPGSVDMTQLKVESSSGKEVKVAWGITASPHNESAVQGIHAPHVLVIVDEAGGIGHTIGGNLNALMTGSDSRMVLIGNPASDNEGSWFEHICEGDRGESKGATAKVVRISAYDTPTLTGEKVGQCMSCPTGVPPHPLSEHLIQPFQVEEAISQHGEDSNYVISKVQARFPKGGSNRVIPSQWVEDASEQPTPENTISISSLGLPEESSKARVNRGAWVRLGIDVAADGGDEFVICRLVGDVPEIVHTSSGAENESAVEVAGKCLEHILKAERLAMALGTPHPVEVKIDGIGVGWGVSGLLESWSSEGKHSSRVTPVIVSEKPKQEPDKSMLRPRNQRAEMWLAMRSMLEPDKQTGQTGLRLNWLDARTRAQFSGPKKLTDTSGLTVIEKKTDMKSRGVKSPDRAEAVILALYQPANAKRRGRLIVN
jgi:hypothetical protein